MPEVCPSTETPEARNNFIVGSAVPADCLNCLRTALYGKAAAAGITTYGMDRSTTRRKVTYGMRTNLDNNTRTGYVDVTFVTADGLRDPEQPGGSRTTTNFNCEKSEI